jgi:hypothetical protein
VLDVLVVDVTLDAGAELGVLLVPVAPVVVAGFDEFVEPLVSGAGVHGVAVLAAADVAGVPVTLDAGTDTGAGLDTHGVSTGVVFGDGLGSLAAHATRPVVATTAAISAPTIQCCLATTLISLRLVTYHYKTQTD